MQAANILALGSTPVLRGCVFWMHKVRTALFRKYHHKMIMGIVSVLVMLAAILALAHLGDAESFMANLGSPLPAFGTVLDPPPEVECNAPAILPNLTFTESDIGITPIATIRDGGDFVLVAADAIAVYEADGRAYALVVVQILSKHSKSSISPIRQTRRRRQ